jgi:hypothetical protein
VVKKRRWPPPIPKGPFCGFAAFTQHVAFGFWKWELLEDQLPGSGETAAGKVRNWKYVR